MYPADRVPPCPCLPRWEFRTEDYDIGFGVVQLDGGRGREVVPVRRVNAHQLGQDGSVTCGQAGMCELLSVKGVFMIVLMIRQRRWYVDYDV